jgi:hypothetical protein
MIGDLRRRSSQRLGLAGSRRPLLQRAGMLPDSQHRRADRSSKDQGFVGTAASDVDRTRTSRLDGPYLAEAPIPPTDFNAEVVSASNGELPKKSG